VRNASENSVPLVRAQEVDATFDRAGKPIATYLAHRDLKPTLRIRSEPEGAQFRMLIGNQREDGSEDCDAERSQIGLARPLRRNDEQERLS